MDAQATYTRYGLAAVLGIGVGIGIAAWFRRPMETNVAKLRALEQEVAKLRALEREQEAAREGGRSAPNSPNTPLSSALIKPPLPPTVFLSSSEEDPPSSPPPFCPCEPLSTYSPCPMATPASLPAAVTTCLVEVSW